MICIVLFCVCFFIKIYTTNFTVAETGKNHSTEICQFWCLDMLANTLDSYAKNSRFNC